MATLTLEFDLFNEESEQETDTPTDQFFKSILENDLEKVKVGISEGFTALTRNEGSEMALHFACLNSKIDVLHLLKETLKEGDIDTNNIEDDDTICGTALHMSMDGQVDPVIAQTLLQWGADPNAKDAKGSTVLQELIYRAWEDMGVAFESEESMLEALESELQTEEYDISNNDQLSANVSDKDDEMGPGNSYFEKLRLLHKHGVDMNLANSETGLSPLHFWMQNFHWILQNYVKKSVPEWCFQFLNLLLNYGANPDCVNERGETPMMFMAQRYYKPGNVDFMAGYKAILALILPKLSDTSMKDMYGRTLLHYASEYCNYVLLECLLKSPCNVNVQDKFGLSPIHIITHCVSKDESPFVNMILDCLAQNGGNVNIQDNYGSTPLHHSVHMKNHVAVDNLLKNDASMDVKDTSGRTVKDLAKLEGDLKILKRLGMEHEISKTEIVKGVSDLRFGWFYPLCCHKLYSDESNGAEETEIVKDNFIEKWLNKYPMCIHNAKAVLQNSVSSLESNEEEMLCADKDAESMKSELYGIAKKSADLIGECNPLFQSNVIFGGSVSEGTKVGSSDEFDLVFDLFRLRQHVEVIEDPQFKGFARLKVITPESKSVLGSLVGDHGFLKRSEVSNTFHKYLETVLRSDQLIIGNNFFSVWGTTNSLGDCFNIGQLHFVWHGPFQKRQDVSVDIAPVIRLNGWESEHGNKNLNIVDKNTARSVGCYLVMKDLSRYLEEFGKDIDDEHTLDSEFEDTLFIISMSQLEHATMKYLPPAIKNGYKIAKSIQLQCPQITFELTDMLADTAILTRSKKGRGLRSVVHVSEYVTSFVLKTGLFYELDCQGLHISFGEADLYPEKWNYSVIHSSQMDTTADKTHVTDAVKWALRIYKRLLVMLEEKKCLYGYFMPQLHATKIRGGNVPFVKVCRMFLKTLIYFLEQFHIPEDIFVQK